jgi:hypothetical protein
VAWLPPNQPIKSIRTKYSLQFVSQGQLKLGFFREISRTILRTGCTYGDGRVSCLQDMRFPCAIFTDNNV